MNLVELPSKNFADIPKMLRNLADEIEAGDFGEVGKVAWVLDGYKAEHFEIHYGLMGQSANPDSVFNTLCDLGKAKMFSEMLQLRRDE